MFGSCEGLTPRVITLLSRLTAYSGLVLQAGSNNKALHLQLTHQDLRSSYRTSHKRGAPWSFHSNLTGLHFADELNCATPSLQANI